ncbi:hypothetical protein B1A_19608 [mine drainage metagenome]|uniref:DUF4435 domain-containing protein n=1 Tax=mine drainage metagenome TaxID=410659 RepID=T0ZQN4_9ZZZZ
MFSNGKDNALEIMAILGNSNFKGVLAIVDTDFWVVENVRFTNPNVLTTDAHDLETMLIFSNALDKVLAEFGSTTKLGTTGKPLRDILVELALPIGFLRLISTPTRKNLQLNFKEMQYGNFIDLKKIKIDMEKMISEVQVKSRNSKIDVKKLKLEIESCTKKTNNFIKYICSGDDLVEILTLILINVVGNYRSKNIDSHSLRAILRLAYDYDSFSVTDLYASVRKWELANGPFKIL